MMKLVILALACLTLTSANLLGHGYGKVGGGWNKGGGLGVFRGRSCGSIISKGVFGRSSWRSDNGRGKVIVTFFGYRSVPQ